LSKLFLTIWGQFQGFFGNLGPTKKMSIAAAIGVVVLAISSLVYFSSGSGYQTLLSNVPSDQMPMLMQKLNAMSVPFELRNNGTSIAVPANLVSAAQMNLMAEVGSSKMGSVGLEVFEKQDFGVNSFAQKVNYQRALQSSSQK
jgi:flagellar M-ring protein FliF